MQFSSLQKLLDEDKEGGAPAQVQHLPDDVVKDLSTIARYVLQSGGSSNDSRTDILLTYAQIRSTTLGRTLSSFTENTSFRTKQTFTSCKFYNITFNVI